MRTASLKRLGNVQESHTIAPQADGSLMASTVVGEPHSFDVEVLADIEGKPLRWVYESYEGRTRIPQAIAEQSGIKVAAAGAGIVADEHEVQGLLTPVEGRSAKVTARFPGPIRQLSANVGDRVMAGQTLAVIESNLSLSNYSITAPLSGVVVARDARILPRWKTCQSPSTRRPAPPQTFPAGPWEALRRPRGPCRCGKSPSWK